MPNGEPKQEHVITQTYTPNLEDRILSLRSELQEAQGNKFDELLRQYISLIVDYQIQVNNNNINDLSDNFVEHKEFQAEDIAAHIGRAGDVATKTKIIKYLEDEFSARLTKSLAKTPTGNSETPKKNNAHEADPIMMFNGQLVHSAEDFQLNGAGFDFVFTRTYKSQVTYDGPLGSNWDHNFNLWLRVSNEIIFCSTGTLREDAYTRHPKFGEAGFNYWVPPDGQDGIILENGVSFILRAPNGSQYVYEQNSALTFIHRIVRIEDRYGNYLRFVYADERLKFVEINHPQRQVQFHHDEQGRVVQIQDHIGNRSWCYAYDDFGDLIAVTIPGTDRYPEGLTTCFEYSSAQFSGELAHNLTRIIDASGQLYLENEYGANPGILDFNRVVRQREGSGERFLEYEDVIQEFDFDYRDEHRPAHQTTMVERNGHPVHFIYNKFGNLLFREENVLENGLQHRLASRYRYNRDGALTAMISPEGVVTQYLYGRDYFYHRYDLNPEDDSSTHDALTTQERQGFGRLLAVVHRGRYYGFEELDFALGIWGDVFPNILGAVDSSDIIQKYTYEPHYGQMLTVSDPRFTERADPAHLESQPYTDTLTTFEYRGATGDPKRFLDRIIYPTPTLPDGTASSAIIERFLDYDDRGKLLSYSDQSGTISEYQYFGQQDGLNEGYLNRFVIDPNGFAITTEYDVDELGRVKKIKPPRSFTESIDRFTSYEYNALDQLTKSKSLPPFNFEAHRFYDKTGNIERLEMDAKDENGIDISDAPTVQTFEYDEEFNLIEQTIGGGNLTDQLVTKHCYDNTGNPSLTILPKGNRVGIAYNERQLAVAQTIGDGSPDETTSKVEYDSDGRPLRSFSARGFSTMYSYDPFGRIVAVEDALGNISRRSYDKAGNIIVVRVFEKQEGDAYVLLARSEFEYDELGRLIRGGVNKFDQLLPATNLETDYLASPGPGRLLISQIFYDVKSRVVKSIDPLLRESHSEYDTLDRVNRVIDPMGNRVENLYDAHNNLIRSDIHEMVRDPHTNQVTGKRIFSSSASFDELDRMVTGTDSLGNIRQLFYDSRGNLTRMIDPLGNVTQTEYDIFNRPVKQISEQTDTGLGGGNPRVPAIVQHEFDDNSNLLTVIDALGRRTARTYDALDRLREIIFPDGSKKSFSYDSNSNLIESIDNNQLKHLFTVDELDRIARIDVDSSNLEPGMQVEGAIYWAYHYDALNRLHHEENDFAQCDIRFNSLGWPVQETQVFKTSESPFTDPLIIARNFNDAGVLNEIVYPGGRTIHYHRDILNRLTDVENIAKGAGYPGDPTTTDIHSVASFQYAGSQRIRCLRGNGTTTDYQHDGMGRIIEIAHAANGNPLLTIQQFYDGAGNMRFRNDISGGNNSADDFAYDSFYRLAMIQSQVTRQAFNSANFTPVDTLPPAPIPNRQMDIDAVIGSLALDPANKTLEYDLVGNRLSEQQSGQGNINYTVNELDQYTQRKSDSYSYDRNGNLISDGHREYRYDSQNRLVHVFNTLTGDSIVRFFHDSQGRRILEIRNNYSMHLLHDGTNLVAEYRDGLLFAQYAHDSGVDRPLQIAADGSEHWYHCDLIGSVCMLTNTNGAESIKYSYLPFGKLLSSTGTQYNPFLYAARRFDGDLEMYDNRARQFDPRMGRFLQRDPVGMIDNTNLYQYAMNNPLSRIDPQGTTSRSELSGEMGNEDIASVLSEGIIDEDIIGGGGLGLLTGAPSGPTLILDRRFSNQRLRTYNRAILDRVAGRLQATRPLRYHHSHGPVRDLWRSLNIANRPSLLHDVTHMGLDLQHFAGDIENPRHRGYLEHFDWEHRNQNRSMGSRGRYLQSQYPGITAQQLLSGEHPPTIYGGVAQETHANRWYHNPRLRTGLRLTGGGVVIYGVTVDTLEVVDAIKTGDPEIITKKVTEKAGAWYLAGKGAAVGATAGTACGPLAWLCVPVGGFAGGAIGYISGSWLGWAVGSLFFREHQPQSIEQIANYATKYYAKPSLVDYLLNSYRSNDFPYP